MQANYIDSLLDGRYLKPLGHAWDYTLFAAWLVFVYLIFWRFEKQPETALLISLLAGLVARYLITQLVLREGLYPELWVHTLGSVALFLRYLDSRAGTIFEKLKRRGQ